MKEERDIGKIIRSSMAGYEEEYSPGAWENFLLKQKMRRRALQKRVFASIAATMLLGLAVLSFLDTTPVNEIIPESELQTIAVVPAPVEMRVREEIAEVITEKAPAIKAPAIKRVSRIKETIMPEEQVLNKPEQTTAALGEEKNAGREKKEQQEIIDDSSPVKEKEEAAVVAKTPVRSIYTETYSNGYNRFDKKVRFGVNLSPGISTTSSAAAFIYSGGVNLDINIADGVDISTGVQLEHGDVINKTEIMEGRVPPDIVRSTMTNIDIPVNITWRFANSRKESFYVSGGISSLACLGETVTTTSVLQELREVADYSPATGQEPQTVFKIENVERTTVEEMDPLGALDFAGRINIIFGYRRSISPKLNLHIEPYLKVPVSGLGSGQIRFTTSGVTCKISF